MKKKSLLVTILLLSIAVFAFSLTACNNEVGTLESLQNEYGMMASTITSTSRTPKSFDLNFVFIVFFSFFCEMLYRGNRSELHTFEQLNKIRFASCLTENVSVKFNPHLSR